MTEPDPQQEAARWKKELTNIPRGMLMGAADIVPGVSGGTMALILGIYDRLVTAISHVDTTLIRLVQEKRWREAAAHFDLAFLLTLGSGIVLGMAAFGTLIRHCMHVHLQLTYAAFFGLIAGSVILVARTLPRWSWREFLIAAAGAIFAVWLVTQPLLQNPPDHPLYLFVCGSIAICAMILPGISGAFILLLLGKYTEMVDLLKGLFKLEIDGRGLTTLLMFLFGCLCGILTFSRILKWLLLHYTPQTLSLLCGFMIGSLWKLWPFQRVVAGTEELKTPLTEIIAWRDVPMDAHFWRVVVLTISGGTFVLMLDFVSKRFTRKHDVESGPVSQIEDGATSDVVDEGAE